MTIARMANRKAGAASPLAAQLGKQLNEGSHGVD